MRTLPTTDRRRPRLLRLLERALDAVAAGAAPPAVRAILAQALTAPAGPTAHRAVATGHAHIDTAWLWPIRETVRKCVRTFASAVALMDDEPDYVFSCSQAQQYEWVRQQEPELFARIAAKVAAGQWVPVGGMWVEPDMNLPSGESIVRQIVHGQRWFAEHFGVTVHGGVDPRRLRLPRRPAAGLRRRRHAPLRHAEAVVEPHQPLPPPHVLVGGSRRQPCPDALPSGRHLRRRDHAGGADGIDGAIRRALVERRLADPLRLRRRRRRSDAGDVRAGRAGSPTSMPCHGWSWGRRPRFFEHVEAEAAAGAPVPVWRGELYFETHRGTLTSQLRTKLGNRRCERLLREAELWAATSAASAETWMSTISTSCGVTC